MLTNLVDHPTIKAKQQPSPTATHKKLSTTFSSWDFEIQEPDDQEAYNPNNTLMYNDLNAYVVDWEMPK